MGACTETAPDPFTFQELTKYLESPVVSENFGDSLEEFQRRSGAGHARGSSERSTIAHSSREPRDSSLTRSHEPTRESQPQTDGRCCSTKSTPFADCSVAAACDVRLYENVTRFVKRRARERERENRPSRAGGTRRVGQHHDPHEGVAYRRSKQVTPFFFLSKAEPLGMQDRPLESSAAGRNRRLFLLLLLFFPSRKDASQTTLRRAGGPLRDPLVLSREVGAREREDDVPAYQLAGIDLPFPSLLRVHCGYVSRYLDSGTRYREFLNVDSSTCLQYDSPERAYIATPLERAQRPGLHPDSPHTTRPNDSIVLLETPRPRVAAVGTLDLAHLRAFYFIFCFF